MSRAEWLNNLCISEVNLVNKYVASNLLYPMKNKGRSHNGFLYTIEGTETYNFSGKSIDAVPNSILFIPKGEKYTINLSDEKSVVITFDFETREMQEMQPFCTKLSKNNILQSRFSEATEKWRSRKPEAIAECKAIFYKIVAELIKNDVYYSNNKSRLRIADAVSYLHSHYFEGDFKISSLPQVAKISPRYFEILFLKEFGTTPRDYVISLKLEQAKELLLNEKNSVSDVAFQLGYSDVYHFSNFFKSKTGYSPSEYKRAKD